MTKNLKIITTLSIVGVIGASSVYPIKLAIDKYTNNHKIIKDVSLSSFEYQKILNDIDLSKQNQIEFDDLSKEQNKVNETILDINQEIEQDTILENNYNNSLNKYIKLNSSFNLNIKFIEEDLTNNFNNFNNESLILKLRNNSDISKEEGEKIKSFFNEYNENLLIKYENYTNRISEYKKILQDLLQDTNSGTLEFKYNLDKIIDINIELEKSITLLKEFNFQDYELIDIYKYYTENFDNLLNLIKLIELNFSFLYEHNINLKSFYNSNIKEYNSISLSLQNNYNLLQQNLDNYKKIVYEYEKSTELLYKTLKDTSYSTGIKESLYWEFVENYKKLINNDYDHKDTLINESITNNENLEIQKILEKFKEENNKNKELFKNNTSIKNDLEQISKIKNHIKGIFWQNSKIWFELKQNILNKEIEIIKNKKLKLNSLHKREQEINKLKTELNNLNLDILNIQKKLKDNKLNLIYLKKEIQENYDNELLLKKIILENEEKENNNNLNISMKKLDDINSKILKELEIYRQNFSTLDQKNGESIDYFNTNLILQKLNLDNINNIILLKFKLSVFFILKQKIKIIFH
ncbi:hypothetical protein RRG50_01950 [Mycoplasmopsis felis]|uniref:hypothetical protein n=1 Tax=Mycoplasmopsis felis TaxID=33923 RepID=UPI002AFED58B|nr:hypothetical protein [Mycoplasmopsis felis]WQQ10644.1 hypothetical protein RRG45_02635 [Mycoplasmopsis felis]